MKTKEEKNTGHMVRKGNWKNCQGGQRGQISRGQRGQKIAQDRALGYRPPLCSVNMQIFNIFGLGVYIFLNSKILTYIWQSYFVNSPFWGLLEQRCLIYRFRRSRCTSQKKSTKSRLEPKICHFSINLTTSFKRYYLVPFHACFVLRLTSFHFSFFILEWYKERKTKY